MPNIDDVLNKADLLTYIQLAGGNPRKTGSRYSCSCVLHGGDNPNALSVYFENGKWKWHCFTRDCGGGDAISFVMAWQKLNFIQACEFILGEKINNPLLLHESAKERLELAKIEEQAARERKEARLKELQLTEKHLIYHNNRAQWARDMWTKRGLDEGMQSFFYLGSVDDFTYKIEDNLYHSPTLTIPFFGEQYELLYLHHRLTNPHNPKDKYRPDLQSRGIDQPQFLAVPPMGFDGSLIIVVEGAIKSAVVWSRITEKDVQVIGTPVQGGYFRLIEKLKGKKPIIIPDPKGNTTNAKVLQQPYDLAKQTGGSILELPAKIDDYILDVDMSSNNLFQLLKQARKI